MSNTKTRITEEYAKDLKRGDVIVNHGRALEPEGGPNRHNLRIKNVTFHGNAWLDDEVTFDLAGLGPIKVRQSRTFMVAREYVHAEVGTVVKESDGTIIVKSRAGWRNASSGGDVIMHVQDDEYWLNQKNAVILHQP